MVGVRPGGEVGQGSTPDAFLSAVVISGASCITSASFATPLDNAIAGKATPNLSSKVSE